MMLVSPHAPSTGFEKESGRQARRLAVPSIVTRKCFAAAGLLFILLIGIGTAFAVDPTTLPDPVLQERYEALTHELRCMQCQNQSIADSPVGLAEDLRREVRNMLLAGKSDQEIRDFMVARYGEFILFRPRFSTRTAWLWLAPALLLLGGILIAIRVIRQRAALVDRDDEPLEEDIRP